MRIALAAARFVNGDIVHNLAQIDRFAAQAREQGAALVCFGEAFLQGFDCLGWTYAQDRSMAVPTAGDAMAQVGWISEKQGVDILLGFLERDGESIYSSCALVQEGAFAQVYRRISRGWREVARTDDHYREGTEPKSFLYRGKRLAIALCGDVWDMPERFALGEDALLWPVYVSYTPAQWQAEAQAEYAVQAAKCCPHTLFINSLCDGDAYGGAAVFRQGRIAETLPMGREGMLLTEL